MDYADQRFYANTQGRFTSPDTYMAGATAANPGSWNKYSYVGGDRINSIEPFVLYAQSVEGGGHTIACFEGDFI